MKDFLILEVLDNLASELDLLKSITKYAPRAFANEFLQFTKQLIETLPHNFFKKSCVTLCSTNNKAHIKFLKEKFNNGTWTQEEIVGRTYKRKTCATVYYYIDNKNLVVLLYAKEFYLKQQALPYAVMM